MHRPPEYYIAPSGDVMVPPEVARILWRHAGLAAFRDRTRIAAHGTEVAPVLEALRQAGERWATSLVPSPGTISPEPTPPMPQSLTTTQAAHHLGITPRAITKAIAEHRLTAQRDGHVWTITPEDLAHFQASRTEQT